MAMKTGRFVSFGGILAGLVLALRNLMGADLSGELQTLFTIVTVIGGLLLVVGLRERIGGYFGTVALAGWVMVGVLALIRFSISVIASNPAAALVAPLFLALSTILLVMVWVGLLATSGGIALGGRGKVPSWFVGLSSLTAVGCLVGVYTLGSSTGYLSYAGEFHKHMLYIAALWLIGGGAASLDPEG